MANPLLSFAQKKDTTNSKLEFSVWRGRGCSLASHFGIRFGICVADTIFCRGNVSTFHAATAAKTGSFCCGLWSPLQGLGEGFELNVGDGTSNVCTQLSSRKTQHHQVCSKRTSWALSSPCAVRSLSSQQEQFGQKRRVVLPG